MRTAIIGAALLVIGAIAVVAGILPLDQLATLADRVLPVLGFVVAVTIVAELAAQAGVFRRLAEVTASAARGHGWALWLFVVALATGLTAYLSLDTTAVLLTPVVVALARHVKLSPLPFALTTIWLANTASLFLPVSNLTNLLAAHALGGISPLVFSRLTIVPAVIAVIVPSAAVFLVFRRQILVRYEVDEGEPAEDRPLFITASVVLAALIPALVSGLPVWIPAAVAAGVLLVAFGIRKRSALRFALVPWQLVLFAAGLFLVTDAVHAAGWTSVLGTVMGTGTDAVELLRVSASGAASANLVNNLPAYLALEPFAGDHPLRLVALLIGVNAGSLITPWASLATLLWHRRLVADGVEVRWSRFVLLGAVVAPVTVLLATLGLAAAHG